MKKYFLVLLYISALFLLIASCASTGPDQMVIDTKDGTFAMEHSNIKRTGLIHIPDSYDGGKQFSLVFGLHGRGGNASGFESFNFNSFADELDFIMIYPNGINGEWDTLSGQETENDDPGFFGAMIDYMKDHYNIDPERIYITGHSMGGYMAYRLAWDMSDRITAIAPSAGQMIGLAPDIDPSPVSVLHFHALDDTIVPFAGNPANYTMSASQSTSVWLKVNKCSDSPRIFFRQDNIRGLIWDSEDEDVDVGLVIYKTGGHGWLPHTTELISDFFYNHPKREVSLRIETSSIKNYYTLNDSIEIIAEQNTILDSSLIKNISLYANGKQILQTSAKPYSFIYSSIEPQKVRLSLKAELVSGEIISSTNSPSLWITSENIAVNATARSSETEDLNLTADKAVDGNAFTRYASEWSDPQWMEIDLNRIRRIDGFTLIWETAYAREFTLETSLNGKDWTIVYEQEEGTGGTEFIRIEPVAAQLIRFNGKKRGTAWGYSLWEIMVHGE